MSISIKYIIKNGLDYWINKLDGKELELKIVNLFRCGYNPFIEALDILKIKKDKQKVFFRKSSLYNLKNKLDNEKYKDLLIFGIHMFEDYLRKKSIYNILINHFKLNNENLVFENVPKYKPTKLIFY